MEQGLAAVLPHFFERVPRGPGQSFAHDLGRETILRGRDAVGVVYTVRDAFAVLGSHHSGCHLGGRAWRDVATCDVARFEHVDVHVLLDAAPVLTREDAALAAEDNVPSTAPPQRGNCRAGGGQ